MELMVKTMDKRNLFISNSDQESAKAERLTKQSIQGKDPVLAAYIAQASHVSGDVAKGSAADHASVDEDLATPGGSISERESSSENGRGRTHRKIGHLTKVPSFFDEDTIEEIKDELDDEILVPLDELNEFAYLAGEDDDPLASVVLPSIETEVSEDRADKADDQVLEREPTNKLRSLDNNGKEASQDSLSRDELLHVDATDALKTAQEEKEYTTAGQLRQVLKLLYKLICLLSIMGLFLGLFVFPQYETNFQASMLDKVHRLESIPGPRIVLVGNSNVAFGFDSKKIEKSIGLPVVNMGLHAGLGNAFLEQVMKLDVHKGDIYVLAETTYDDDDVIDDPTLAWITIEDHPSLWRLIRAKDIPRMISAFPIYLRKCLNLWIRGTGNQDDAGPYTRAAFDRYGDNTWPRPHSKYTFSKKSYFLGDVGGKAIERIKAFDHYLKEHGARLVIAAHPIGKGPFTPDTKRIQDFQKKLESAVDVPVISEFSDYLIPYNEFYDTDMHLTDSGVEERTDLLIHDLKQYMKEEGLQVGRGKD